MNYEVFETKERVLADNERAAREIGEMLREKGAFFVNLMASPGAGKTTTLERLIELLKDKFRIGVMEADADGETDAARVEAAGARAIQLHTGGLCHMDADMTKRGLERLGTDGLDLIFLENVGNLVCPAEFDTGADLKLMILSVPEGDDKPLKYPLIFRESDALVITKCDALSYFDFDIEKCRERAKKLNPAIEIYPVSAKTGEGMEALERFLEGRLTAWRELPYRGDRVK